MRYFQGCSENSNGFFGTPLNRKIRLLKVNITVYAASSGQVPDKYIDMARQLGTVMAQAGHTLINGAGRTGLMGATADAVLSAGGKAIGVIPQFMIDQGWQHPSMAQLVVTKDMHER